VQSVGQALYHRLPGAAEPQPSPDFHRRAIRGRAEHASPRAVLGLSSCAAFSARVCAEHARKKTTCSGIVNRWAQIRRGGRPPQKARPGEGAGREFTYDCSMSYWTESTMMTMALASGADRQARAPARLPEGAANVSVGSSEAALRASVR
jgi:hypothetical protein